jgi:serine protease Do
MRKVALALVLFGAFASSVSTSVAAETRGVKLARVTYQIQEGAPWGVEGWTVVCAFPKKKLYWQRGVTEMNPDRPNTIVQQELKNYGVIESKTTDLFEEAKGTELLLGAVILSVDADLCTLDPANYAAVPSAKIYSGTMAIRVEWQLFDPVTKKTLARFTTSGGGEQKQKTRDGLSALLEASFRTNAKQLIAGPTFREAIMGKTQSSDQTIVKPIDFTPIDIASVSMAKATKSVVSIFAGDSMGSGVLVGIEGYVLTNHHVAGGTGQVRVKWSDGVITPGVVIRSDARRDVALIKTDAKALPLPLRKGKPEIGETVYAIGTPLDAGLQGTLTKGVVSGLRDMEGQPFIQSDVAVTHGNSGGPLLNENGQVVALTVSGREVNGAPTSLNFFIPIDDALKALSLQPVGTTP